MKVSKLLAALAASTVLLSSIAIAQNEAGIAGLSATTTAVAVTAVAAAATASAKTNTPATATTATTATGTR